MTVGTAIWSGAMTLAGPVLRVTLWRRVARGKEIAGRLGERRGIEAMSRPAGKLIWLHAASVGETMSILPVIDILVARGVHVLVTTGTVTSARLLASRALPGVTHRFVPLDVPAWAARFLDHWRPDAGGFVESELWPNLLAAARRLGVPMVLINARLSAGSAAIWGRAPATARAVLATFTSVLAQSDVDASRFRKLGATDVISPGNLKFAASALPANRAEITRLRDSIGDRPTWLAASTHEADDAPVQAAHDRLRAKHPNLLTIVAPRHPERGAALSVRFGDAPRRALGQCPDGPVWIADTLGELGLLYRLVPVVFMGKSLLPPGGGQNPLEPARLGCAVATGPHVANFSDAVALLTAAGGLVTVSNDLADWVARMWADPATRDLAGKAAQSVANAYADLPTQVANRLLRMAGSKDVPLAGPGRSLGLPI